MSEANSISITVAPGAAPGNLQPVTRRSIIGGAAAAGAALTIAVPAIASIATPDARLAELFDMWMTQAEHCVSIDAAGGHSTAAVDRQLKTENLIAATRAQGAYGIALKLTVARWCVDDGDHGLDCLRADVARMFPHIDAGLRARGLLD